MIKHFILATLLLTCNSLKAQFITEHLIEVNKSYNPIFGSGKGSLRASLDLTYKDNEKGDSILNVVVSIEQLKATLTGSSKSISVGGGGLGDSWGIIGGIAAGLVSNKAYALTNTNGLDIINKKQLDSLISSFDRIKYLASFNQGYNKTVLFRVGKILLGLDLENKGTTMTGFTLTKKFYIQIDESAYSLSENEFNDLYENAFKAMKASWETFLNYRTIQTPTN